MTLRAIKKPGPIRAVLFDFHSTLVDQGDPHHWVDLAWAHARRPGTPREALGEAAYEALTGWVHRIWEHVLEVDPHNERDLSSARHREVYDALMERVPQVDDGLAHALYAVMLEPWMPYDDAVPTLRELRRRGIKVALVSNVGLDIRPVLARAGMADLFDAVILSYEAGAVKPDASIFLRALAALGVEAGDALMVGDNPQDDVGAARLGVRTLLLPRTEGAEHGLEVVLRIVG